MFSQKKKLPDHRHYGRRISKKLSQKKLFLLNNFFEKYSFDDEVVKCYEQNKKLNLSLDIKKKFSKINIEIGFGDGEFLLKNAILKPDELFIGCEVYINGIAEVLSKIIKFRIKNIKLSNLNILYLLGVLPHKSVDNLFIINPDPWHKKKHHKRRLLSYKNINFFNQIIKSKNSIYITTDSYDYMKYVRDRIKKKKNILGNITIKTLSMKDKFYGISKFQRKGIEKGRKIYLIVI